MPNPKSLRAASKTALTINTTLAEEVAEDDDDSENDQVRGGDTISDTDAAHTCRYHQRDG
jgi:hypothetical protein